MSESSYVLRRALISTFDKTGLVALGRFLAAQGVEVIATGNSARRLLDEGIPVLDVAECADLPDTLDGRLKTLHAKLYAGILSDRGNPQHMTMLDEHQIKPIDLVVVNLPPFAAATVRGASMATCLENIDIGAAALIRAAARNHECVAVLTSPDQYAPFMTEVEEHGGSMRTGYRRGLAASAFSYTAARDSMIAAWFSQHEGESFPERISFSSSLRAILSSAQNPQQQAALYVNDSATETNGLAAALMVEGECPGHPSWIAADAAHSLVMDLQQPAVVLAWHGQVRAVAQGSTLLAAWQRLEGSAVALPGRLMPGAVLAVNRPLSDDLVDVLVQSNHLPNVIVSPDAAAAARGALREMTDVVLLLTRRTPPGHEHAALPPAQRLRSISGGTLIETADAQRFDRERVRYASAKLASESQMSDLILAFMLAKHVPSPALVLVRDGASLAISGGQANWDQAARLALMLTPDASHAVAALDMPLDNPAVLQTLIEAGIKAVIHPGGQSHSDELLTQLADQAGICLLVAHTQHARY